MRQRVVRHERSDVPQFRGLGFKKIAPRRHAVEKIGHADRGSRRKPFRLDAHQLAAGKLDARSLLFLRRARLQQQARYRRDRRQRFPAKPERCNREQIVGRAQFRRSVPLERQQRIVLRHAAAVIDHANHPLAAGFHLNANRLRTRVERVLEQFLDHGRRPLDYLARGDLVRNVLRKYAYSCHFLSRISDFDSIYFSVH